MTKLYYFENMITRTRSDFYLLETTELGSVVEYYLGNSGNGLFCNPDYSPVTVHNNLDDAIDSMGVVNGNGKSQLIELE